MRLIFFTLFGLNLLVVIWGVFFREDLVSESSPIVMPAIKSEVKTITTSVTSPATEFAAPNKAADKKKKAPQNKLCELVGAFDSAEDAEVLTERLRSIDIESSIEKVELETGKSYWVHLKAEETSSAAFDRLAELQALNIESYVIGRGDLKNAVSLGVFTHQNLAIRKKDEVEGQGFEPVITTKPRTQIEIWVSITPEYAEKISDSTWEKMLEGMSSQERRQNYCLPVDS